MSRSQQLMQGTTVKTPKQASVWPLSGIYVFLPARSLHRRPRLTAVRSHVGFQVLCQDLLLTARARHTFPRRAGIDLRQVDVADLLAATHRSRRVAGPVARFAVRGFWSWWPGAQQLY